MAATRRQQASLAEARLPLASRSNACQDLVGVRLFRKQGRNVVLTSQGELAVHHAKRILQSNDEMLNALRGSRAKGKLRIGIGSDFTESVLPLIFKHVHHAYPELEFDMKIDRNGLLHKLFGAGELDLVLTLGPLGSQLNQIASVALR